MIVEIVLFILIAYLIGCFCGAYYYGKIFKKTDLRQHGSGNLGARNTGRVFGPIGFVVVFLIDFAKAWIVVWVGNTLGLSDIGLLLGIYAVVIGHMFPVQLQYRGGIGIASFLGGLIAFDAMLVLILIVTFAICYGITRKLTLSGFIAMCGLPLLVFTWGYPDKTIESILLLGLAVMIMIKHQ